jgi:hypothetical protein
MDAEKKSRVKKLITFLLFASTFLVVILTIPREGRFKYEFQKGKPWMHEDLFAPFDFPVYKTDQEIFAEKNRLLKEFKSYYRYDSTIQKKNVLAFVNGFDSIFENYSTKKVSLIGKRKRFNKQKALLKELIENELNEIYSKGIIDQTDGDISKGLEKKGLAIVINNIAYEKWFDDVYTLPKAYRKLNDKLLEQVSSEDQQLQDILLALDLKKYLEPNLFYDEITTKKFRDELISNISITKGMIQAGEMVIAKGEIVNSENYQVLESLKREYEKKIGAKRRAVILTGNILLISSLFIAFYLFLLNFRLEVLTDYRKLLFLLLNITLMVVLARLINNTQSVSINVLPLAIIPIFVKIFFDSRLALFVHLISVFVVGFMVPNSYEFVFTNFIAGVVAIVSLSNIYQRGQLFKTVGLIYMSYIILNLSFYIIADGSLSGVNWFVLLWYAVNALLLLASYQLVYLIEKVFGFLSDITLIEISDTNLDLLRKLAEVAPGTFQHSLQVANLAESAVQRVGGNPLLVRAGALYHDIGKMANPMFFVENQQGGFNPHENVSNVKSAEIIINHVHEGVKIATKAGLHQQIVDFIRMHHGTSLVKFFYTKEMEVTNGDGVDENQFRYPGPEPQTKETAILMMADAVEAASRSLKEYTVQSIDNLVEKIINEQLNSGQFNYANINFKDISLIKAIFKKKLQNIYHVRLEYPEMPKQVV